MLNVRWWLDACVIPSAGLKIGTYMPITPYKYIVQKNTNEVNSFNVLDLRLMLCVIDIALMSIALPVI
jgi:hypothetical protein